MRWDDSSCSLQENRADNAPPTGPFSTTYQPKRNHMPRQSGKSIDPHIAAAHQLPAELHREKPRHAYPHGENRTPSVVGEEARENRTWPAWRAQHSQNTDHQRPTHSHSKPALFCSASITTSPHPDFLGQLVSEVRWMRLRNAPLSLPRDISPGPEYEEDDCDVGMKYSKGFEDGVWDGNDVGTPDPIPTPLLFTPEASSVKRKKTPRPESPCTTGVWALNSSSPEILKSASGSHSMAARG
jgi:hypothetical protein